MRRQLRLAGERDPGIKSLIAVIGYPEPRKRNADFETLLQVIVSQQISTHAAAAVFDRLRRHCRGQVTWRKILNRDLDTLRECGLSYRKAEYAHGLASMFQTRQLDLESMRRSDSETVISRLTEIRGFGRWSAEIFAMFALQHPDIFPADDLALRIAVQRFLKLNARPTGRETMKLAARWSPCRSAVALLMWKYYGSTTLD